MSRALWAVGPGRVALRDEELPAPGPDDVRVRALFSGISRGTERLVTSGGVPASQHASMRAPFQVGDFGFPLKYGYISVGEIEETGARVFCLHPHQDRYVVPRSALVPLPEGVPPARAVLTANLETAVNAVWDAAPGPGDRVAVVGAGVVGALVAWLIGRIPGTEVQLVDVLPDRAVVADALGVGFASPDQAWEACDLVVHATASASGLATALRLAGVEATVLELSWYGDRAVSAPLGEAFHHRRLTLRSSQVGRIPPGRSARWTYRRRLEVALGLLDPALDILIDGESTFEELPRDYVDILARPGLCHRVRYGQTEGADPDPAR